MIIGQTWSFVRCLCGGLGCVVHQWVMFMYNYQCFFSVNSSDHCTFRHWQDQSSTVQCWCTFRIAALNRSNVAMERFRECSDPLLSKSGLINTYITHVNMSLTPPFEGVICRYKNQLYIILRNTMQCNTMQS